MGHLKIMKLMSHIDEAIDILVKNDHLEDADVLSIFSKKYRIMYQIAVKNSHGNS